MELDSIAFWLRSAEYGIITETAGVYIYTAQLGA